MGWLTKLLCTGTAVHVVDASVCGEIYIEAGGVEWIISAIDHSTHTAQPSPTIAMLR